MIVSPWNLTGVSAATFAEAPIKFQSGETQIPQLRDFANLRRPIANMVTSSNRNIFRVIGLLWGNRPVDSPHKGQRRGALMFCLICARTNGWANTWDAGDWGCHRAHYDITVISERPAEIGRMDHHVLNDYQCTCVWTHQIYPKM